MNDYPNSIPEALAKLNCGRSYLYELMKAGHIKFVKQGKNTRIFDSSIAAYLDSLKVGA